MRAVLIPRCVGVLLGWFMALSASGATFFNTNATWKYFKGTAEASTPMEAWRGAGFVDAGWESGVSPLFYGDPLLGTELPDMRGNYSSVYFRRTFQVQNAATVPQLQLDLFIDDGCVVWINGTEVARVNAPAGDLTFDATALGTIDETALPVSLVLESPSAYLKEGENLIAVHGFNASLSGSSDFQFSAALRSPEVDLVPPVIESHSPSASTVADLTQITVVFSEPVLHVDASDLLINGSPAAAVSGSDNTYTFTFSPPAFGTVLVRWAPGHGITDLGIPPNPFDGTAAGAIWQYTFQDLQAPTAAAVLPVPGGLVRQLKSIEVQFSEPVTGVDPADLLINGKAATGITQFSESDYLFTFTQPSTGLVQVAWAATPGIKDKAATPNSFAGGVWTYLLDTNAALSDIVINEFLAVNEKGIRDEQGDASDWIEIRNAGTTPVDLFGWSLTDDPKDLAKWRFPHVVLNAASYLVVFADEKNRTNAAGVLHTNFKLEKNGEYLALVQPDRVTIATEYSPAYPAQRADVSYGLDQLTRVVAGYFASPTPGAANSQRGNGFAPDVEFSKSGGTFTSPFLLTLSTLDPTAKIRYTVDGTVPTTNSALFTDPISISSKRRIRARSFQTGLIPGPVRSEYFLPMAASAISASSDLPIVVIDTFGSAIPNDGDLPAFLAVYEPGANKRTSLTNQATLTTRIAMDKRGSSTLGNAKGNYNVEAWDEANSDKKVSMLGLPEESDFVFHAPFNFDPSLMHNPLASEISLQMGHYASRYRFVEVYVNTGTGALDSTHYVGVYNILEKIKRSDDRVNIARLDPQDVTAPDVTGGYIFKVDRTDPGDSGFGAGGQFMAYFEPKESELITPQRAPQKNYLSQYINDFGNALSGSSFADPVNGYAKYIDVPSWIDIHIINVMTFNVDALRLSAFYHKDRSGRIMAGPIWDFDRALGSTDGRDANPFIWRSAVSDRGTDFFGYGTQAWWGRLFEDPEFWQQWIDRWQDLRAGTLGVTNLNAIIDRMNAQVLESSVRDLNRWGNGKRGGSQATEIAFLKDWLSKRLRFMDTNFLARPVLNQLGGEYPAGFKATLTGPSGAQIYYTTNGTDPRAKGGGVAAAAKLYSGPIALTSITDLRARAFNASHNNLTGPDNPPLSSHWSGLTRARFTPFRLVRPGDLEVTEIHYHPEPPTPSERALNATWTADSFEFLEMRNLSSEIVDLYGARFTKGFDFNFATSSVVTLAPNQRCLLVADPAAFVARYGAGPIIAGTFSGSLDDSGESIRLESGSNLEIFEFAYNDGWYPVTDGLGYSLVLRTPGSAVVSWSHASAWRSSGERGGSPGVTEGPLPSIPGVVINEALTHTDLPQLDAIELFNPTANAVDVGGWYLSDNRSLPKKFRIPAPSVIPPGGYRKWDESDFNTVAAGTNAFRMSALGDSIWLFAGDASGTILPYAHGFDFGASFNGVSFGRYLNSVGHEDFVQQTSLTLGAANSGPRIGPIVINEVMYHPPDLLVGTNRLDDVAGEYIELHNLTSNPVTLFDPAFPTNSWRLRDAVSFAFPSNSTLSASGFLLVVSFDPATNATSLTAFRTRYGIPVSVPIYGPYDGKLDNSEDSVELVRPDAPTPPPDPNQGVVPFILVDRVHYSQLSPWPTNADGGGASLQRKVSSDYGNDPANWYTTTSTAGRVNDFGPVDSDGDGMPDAWETLYGLDKADPSDASRDLDGDGRTNLEEFLSGTDPRSAASALRLLSAMPSLDGASVEVRFQGVAGRSYSLLRRGSLNDGAWIKVRDIAPLATDQTVIIQDAIGLPDGQRFYRLVTPAQ